MKQRYEEKWEMRNRDLPDRASAVQCMPSNGEIEKMWGRLSVGMQRVDIERAKEMVWLRQRSRRQVWFVFAGGGFFGLQPEGAQMVGYLNEESFGR